MKRYRLKSNTIDVNDDEMKGQIAYHFYLALHPNGDHSWDDADEDVKAIMKGLADIAYEQIEKHMFTPAPEPSPSVPVANTEPAPVANT